jgi:hypothetical protein
VLRPVLQLQEPKRPVLRQRRLPVRWPPVLQQMPQVRRQER